MTSHTTPLTADPHPPAEPGIDAVRDSCERIARNVETVIDGKSDVIGLVLAVILAEGHLLIEDVPGVGKTTLAKAVARSLGCTARRLQFTPDLLPSDVTGVSVFNQQTRDFEFKPGPLFANVVLGDEINRASPHTQSALLEAMEERHATVDGVSHPLPTPFLVIATQNPVEMAGTYPLPESQRDRFTARVAVGYPDPEAELRMLTEHASADPLATLAPVTTATGISAMIAAVRRVHVADAVRRYAVELANATRRHPLLRLGASPRATLQLVKVAKAWAAMDGRDYVLPDDLQHLAPATLAHRLLLTAQATAQHSAESIVAELVARLSVTADTGSLRRR